VSWAPFTRTTTIMSRPPLPKPADIVNLLQLTSQSIAQMAKVPAEVTSTLNTFFSQPHISPLVDVDSTTPCPRCTSHTPPHPMDEDSLKAIQSTLQGLTKAVMGLQNKKPPPPPKPPQPNNPRPSYASKAMTKPTNPSLVITLSHLATQDFTRPRPVDICTTLNIALTASPHNHVHISAVRWTAKGNLVVTGGHTASEQQLQLATPIITKAFTDAYSNAETPFSAPLTRANVKWSKILINGLPTGVSNSRAAYSPDECHTALASENPSYSPLIIAQKPSWVKPPHSFTPGSSSSLVVAFEDPDGTKARMLLGAKHLYAFGTRATLRKWKQRPTPPTPPSPSTTNTTEIVVAPAQQPSPFTFSGPVSAAKPATRRSMTTRGAIAKKKS
jgi:hypothetical protein